VTTYVVDQRLVDLREDVEVQLTCETCGRSFTVKRAANRQRVCAACRTKGRSQITQDRGSSIRASRGAVERTCPVCGKVFESPGGRRTCSHFCQVTLTRQGQREAARRRRETYGDEPSPPPPVDLLKVFARRALNPLPDDEVDALVMRYLRGAVRPKRAFELHIVLAHHGIDASAVDAALWRLARSGQAQRETDVIETEDFRGVYGQSHGVVESPRWRDVRLKIERWSAEASCG